MIDRNASPKTQYTLQIMTTEQEIKDHTKKIESGEHPCYSQSCPHCAAQDSFQVHECRRRSFRMVVGDFVSVFRSWILRLKCPRCHRTFTDYPPFRLAPQAIREPRVAGDGARLLGHPEVLSPNGPAPADVAGVRRSAGEFPGPSRSGVGAQHALALVILAGGAEEDSAGGNAIDQPKIS